MVARYRQHGEAGLQDRCSAPSTRPIQTPVVVVERIAATWKNKWSARRIVRELTGEGVMISVATVTRWLQRLGVNRLGHLGVEANRCASAGRSRPGGPAT